MTTTVALVDDHALLRSGLVSIINGFDGFSVLLEAGHGKEFIDQVDIQNPPNIVLLDINMPVMDGYETAIWIKKNLPSSKVLVLSMLTNDMPIIRMLRNGVKGYLIKESMPNVFKEALESVRDNIFYVNEQVRDKLIKYVSKEEDQDQSTKILLNITEQEAQFLQLICVDKTYKDIALEMGVGLRSLDTFRDNLFKKLGVNTRVGLVLFAIKQGIVAI
ncbi:MAG: DNA-binding response regulator [Sphingobacteriia bacterium]|nr:MAG: DNA-binding response regulator [Sphingobacteriia bacterium]TAG29810.1 MAG: DNA-binding response regulator [Sphingobacteriia bacterium]TAH06329.1 MAG: DNA-binding response regulator [Sphingobacteriia bacterium]